MYDYMQWTDRLKQNVDEYRPITFWSWNAELEEPLLRKQIKELKKAGMGGFFMHARSGLKTPYMGDKWFKAVEVSMDEARKQGMQAWCYDENGWPSGFAGMKLLEDPKNWVHYITFEENDFFDESALAVYTLENGRLERLPGEKEGIKCYYTLYDCTNSSVVDILNEEIVRKFIQLTHEKYYEKFGPEFGNQLIGFFTDEPQFFRYDTPYSPILPELYYERYHEDLLDGLAALFLDCDDCYRFRYRYWKLLNDQFTKSFAKQVYEWCEAHNCKLTGHAVEESTLFTQMWCCAGVMPFYEYEHIPGCDWLGREIGTELSPKQVGSVAQQLGKKQVITESFACTGWDVTPRELKRILDWQYVNGVNTLCTHLTPYSLEGNRKFDYPAFFCKANPWFEQFGTLSDYAAKLGCMLAESREYAPVGVIHPIHSAYLTYKRREDYQSVEALETSFQGLIEKLGARNIPHHYIDETLLARYGEVCGNKLKVGNCQYESIVIPKMQQLDGSTVDFLKQFVENGGKLWVAGEDLHYVNGEEADLSFLKSNITFEELKADRYSIETDSEFVRSTYRVSEKGNFIYVVNLDINQTAEIDLNVKAGGMLRLHIEDDTQEQMDYISEGERIQGKLQLRPGEAVILLLCKEPAAAEKEESGGKILFSEPIMTYSDSNVLVIDRVRLSYDNVNYTDLMPVQAAGDYLLSKCENRNVYLEYTFSVQEVPGSLKLEMEKMNAEEIMLNGNPVNLNDGGILDEHFISGNVLPYIIQGENRLVIKIDYYQQKDVYDVLYHTPDVTESLINCLTYDTEISNLYLRGQFGVYSDQPLTWNEDGIYILESNVSIGSACKAKMKDITGSGYPFFAGQMMFEMDAEVDVPGSVQLHLAGRFGSARIRWNEYETDAVISEYVTIPEIYVKQKNKVVVSLYSGNRNLLGPHHLADDLEPKTVVPTMFTMRSQWENGKCANYRDSYSFVPFGIEIEALS